MVKKFWRYVYSFWQNVRTWQTDEHTTETPHDDIGHACIALHSKNCKWGLKSRWKVFEFDSETRLRCPTYGIQSGWCADTLRYTRWITSRVCLVNTRPRYCWRETMMIVSCRCTHSSSLHSYSTALAHHISRSQQSFCQHVLPQLPMLLTHTPDWHHTLVT